MKESNKSEGARNEERHFVEHLEQASQIVRSWPAWKRAVLGGEVEHGQCEADEEPVRESRVACGAGHNRG
jgi:hypothetical protein